METQSDFIRPRLTFDVDAETLQRFELMVRFNDRTKAAELRRLVRQRLEEFEAEMAEAA